MILSILSGNLKNAEKNIWGKKLLKEEIKKNSSFQILCFLIFFVLKYSFASKEILLKLSNLTKRKKNISKSGNPTFSDLQQKLAFYEKKLSLH